MADKVYPLSSKVYYITESDTETPEVQIVRMKAKDGTALDFDAGMFAMISGIEKGTGKQLVARAYSIASEPKSEYLEFYIVKEHDGHKSYFTLTKQGDEYLVKGPYGQFKFVPEQESKVLFIAGGTGLAPFMSMLRHIKLIKSNTDAILLYSVKFPTEIIRKSELEALESEIGMKMIVTVTRPQPGDGWTGQTGHINADMIKKYVADLQDRTVYICGPLAFVKAIKDALAALSVPNERVKADVWG